MTDLTGDEQPIHPRRGAVAQPRMVFVPHIADGDAPTVAEINAATSVDVSGYLAFGPTFTLSKPLLDQPTTYDWPDLEYVYYPDGTGDLAWLHPDPSPLYVYNPQGERVGIVEAVERDGAAGLDVTIVPIPLLWPGDQA